jgi:hypothetical protein
MNATLLLNHDGRRTTLHTSLQWQLGQVHTKPESSWSGCSRNGHFVRRRLGKRQALLP